MFGFEATSETVKDSSERLRWLDFGWPDPHLFCEKVEFLKATSAGKIGERVRLAKDVAHTSNVKRPLFKLVCFQELKV
jgi:hypothetical protein